MFRRRARDSRARMQEYVICLGLFLVAEVAVRAVALPAVARWFGVPLGGPAPQVQTKLVLPRWVQRPLVVTERIAAAWPVGPEGKCLRQALVTGHRLRSLDPVLVVGVRRDAGEMKAHAWVEVDGVALDRTASRYERLTRLAP